MFSLHFHVEIARVFYFFCTSACGNRKADLFYWNCLFYGFMAGMISLWHVDHYARIKSVIEGTLKQFDGYVYVRLFRFAGFVATVLRVNTNFTNY